MSNSKRVRKPGEQAYFWLSKLLWKDNYPEQVMILSERGEDGTYFVTYAPSDKDAWFIVSEGQLWDWDELPSEVRPFYLPMKID